MKTCFSSLFAIVLLFTFSLTRTFADPGDEHWSYQFGWPGTLENVNAIRVHQGKLYFAGGFTGGTSAGINVWDGNQFTRFGGFSGGIGTTINDMVFVGNTLYAAGFFTNVDGLNLRGVARWNGSAWSEIGFTNGTAVALATDGTDLYVGGVFTNPGGVALTNIGRWDGNAWHALGSGLGGTNTIPNDVVRAILITNGVIYAAGNFSNAGTQALRNIAMWNGVTWAPVGGDIPGTTVYGLAWHGSSLYAVGTFNQAGATPVSNVARWDGTNWFALGAGVPGGAVASIATLNGLICVAGNFTSAGGTPAVNFAVWDGTNWSSAGANFTALAFRVYSTGTNIYVGGNFLAGANGIMAGLAAWDGARWSPIGPAGKIAGLQTSVRSILSDGSNIYAGGAFTYAGRTNAIRVGRFDGTNWSAFGAGVTGGDVNSLAFVGTNLYAGGVFTGPSSGGLARWNGSGWAQVGNTSFTRVNTLATRGNDLFIAGYFFATASDGPADWLVRWDGTNYFKVLAFDSSIASWLMNLNSAGFSAMAIDGTNIYLSGLIRLTQCDPGHVNCTNCDWAVRFDGVSVRAMGTGLSTNATTIAVLGTNVFYGGSFTNAGGVAANRIARWDGRSWSAVGGGVVGSGSVSALTTMGGNLFVGGSFTNMGGVAANRIAKWDGTNWSALGSGTVFNATAGPVLALRAVGQDLYVGGTFQTAGGKPSYYLARWNEGINFDPLILRFISPSKTGGNPFQATVTASGATPYIIERSTDFSNWTPIFTNATTNLMLVDSNAPASLRHFYRAHTP